MADSVIETIRAEAKARGVPWSWVLAACRELREQEAAAREHANAVRREAWTFYTALTPWAWSWWRVGFRTRFRKLVEAHDYKAVPGYDVLHQEMAAAFPEFADDGGCERLWSFLLSPYNPVPKRAELLGRAMEVAAAAREAESVGFAFGANCVIS
jgi:hypothetical protein